MLLIAIIVAFLVFLAINITAPLKIQGDGVFYYSWLRSGLLDHDLNFRNELQHYSSYDFYSKKFIEDNVQTATGRIPNPFAFGAAIMWLPLILIAHLATWISHNFNPSFYSLDGYSYWYNLAVNLSSFLFGILALIINYKTIKLFFSKKTSLKTILAIWLTTPWIYYQFLEPGMSHMASLFLVSCFLLIIVKEWQEKKTNAWLFALIIFLVVATRWQNLIFILAYLPIIWQHRKKAKLLIKKILTLLAPIILFFVCQSFIWNHIYGQYILIPQGQGFILNNFSGLYTLFSSDRGLFLWSPILVLAMVGLYFLWNKSKFLAGITLAVFIGQWLLNSSLNDLGGGDAFGARRFIETLPFLALALAALFNRLKKYNWQLWLMIILFIFWNFLLVENFRLGVLPRSGEFDFMKINYFEVIARDFIKFF